MKARVDELRRGTTSVLTCTGKVEHVVTTGDVDDYGNPVVVRTLIFQGRCLVYPADRDATVVEAASQTIPVARYTVLLPHEVDAQVGHRFEVLASPDNPALVGAVFRITDAPLDAWAILRHCVAERHE